MHDDTGFDRETDVVVVGAGIAGLVTAVTAAQAGARVTVLEANDLGGRARTAQRDGFALNIGPHALYNEGTLRQVLASHLIDLPGGSVAGRGLGLVRNGARHQVTISPIGLAKSPVLKPRSRAKVLALFARLPRMDPTSLVGRTVADWLGDEPEDVQQFVQAFVRVSSYTHAPDEHDAGAAVTQVQLALHGVRYLDGGWTSIVDALTARAIGLGVKVHTHAPVSGHDGRRRTSDGVGERRRARGRRSRDRHRRARRGHSARRAPTSLGAMRSRAPVRASSLDLAVRRPFPDCFTLGMDRPVYLSPHAPTAKLAPDGQGLVSAMRYLSPGEDAGEPAAARDELARPRPAGRASPTPTCCGSVPCTRASSPTARRRPPAVAWPAGRASMRSGCPACSSPATGSARSVPWPMPARRAASTPVVRPHGTARASRHERHPTDRDVTVFDAERPRLVGLAYRLLGSVADAEDVVQEAWFRWAAADRDAIERPAAWLTTVVSRLGLDRLRAAQRARIDYVGPWLPEPIVEPMAASGPEHAAELSDSLTTAFLVLLERLTPDERLVVLLVDVFGESFATAATTTGRTEESCRQLAVRARRKLHTEPGHTRSPRSGASAREELAIATAFVGAVMSGDVDTVMSMLTPTAVLVSDGGPRRHAARRPVVGAERIARFVINIGKRAEAASLHFDPVWVNGRPGVQLSVGGRPYMVSTVDIVDGRIDRYWSFLNPDKLASIGTQVELV